jgi:prepilin-type N-terminal cleavage/methylation domain-containing protein
MKFYKLIEIRIMTKNKKSKWIIKNNLWFTLVELIVVITIVSILSTIAFMSFQWYTQNARDTVRIQDIENIQESLLMYVVKTWNFPDPTDWVNIVYSWATVWIQWFFWDSMLTNIWMLNKIPLDPLKYMKYSYSVTPDKQEYQLVWVLEWWEIAKNNFLLNKTYASTSSAKVYSVWTYNWLITKISTGGIDYILALPSITTSSLNQTDLTQIINNRSLVYNNYWSFPSNFSESYSSDKLFDFYPNKLVLFSDSFTKLSIPENQIKLLKEIQNSYIGTIVVKDDVQIKNIVDANIDILSPSNKSKVLACSLINFSLKYYVNCDNIDYITFFIINVLHLDINNLPWDTVSTVYKSKNWDLRFWTNWWVGYYDWTNWKIYNKSNSELVSNDIYAIAEDSEWAMWFGTNQWISIFENNEWSSINTKNSDLLHNHILQIYAASDWKMRIWTNIWVNSYNSWIWEDYTKKKIWLSHNQVNSIYEDNLSNIWF